ncbi:MAG: chromosomal replication initiator protein DnaA [Coriobacteriia bacterium]|nr:chromosomal replication initiator protein DnaA [Coriobacteriia bacterium]MCL2749685.1 chromosomal replication initiator protein DnaA [Coriobacteriia bacterium]
MREVSDVWGQAHTLLLNTAETTDLAKVWLSYLVPVSYDENQIVFAVKFLQAKNWIEERYLPYIMEAIAAVLGSPREVVLIIDETLGQYATTATTGSISIPAGSPVDSNPAGPAVHAGAFTSQATSPVTTPVGVPGATSSFQAVGTTTHENPGRSSGLSSIFAQDDPAPVAPVAEPQSRLVFKNYVVGNSNSMAYSTSLRVAENPGLYLNPLFIHGKSGLGKTHLLRSIENYIKSYLFDKRVVYSPINDFISDYVNAIAEDRNLTSFKLKYHTCDVLLIDDVQVLEGKEGTTDALFEIFNMFYEKKKQIVLSADRSPIEINIDERFTSRFAWGATAEIHPPNYEMKTAILKNYKRYCCSFLQIPEVSFEDEAIQKIVELSGSNIRELEGAVNSLIAFASSNPERDILTPIACGDVERILGDSFFHQYTRRVDFDMVMRAVESYFKVTRAELLSEKRSKNITHPRQVAMYLIRQFTDMSYPEIGDGFHKDHTSVIYADKNIQAKMVKEASIKKEVEKIAEILTS